MAEHGDSIARGHACLAALGASTGPASHTVRVHVSVPTTAVAGDRLVATTTLVVAGDSPRVILQPAGSGLALLRDDAVVAWVGGEAVATSPVPMPLTAGTTRPAQVVPTSLPLTGDDGEPLPAGRYVVRAVVGYGGDPLNAGAAGGSGSFHLVSGPITVTLR